MKIFITLTILLFTTNSFSQETFAFNCSNFNGSSVDYANGKSSVSADGYSGTTISIIVGKNGTGTVTYKGNNNRTDAISLLSASSDFMTFYKTFNDVHKLYTLYYESAVLSIIEIQTQLYSGDPQVRTFIGKCY